MSHSAMTATLCAVAEASMVSSGVAKAERRDSVTRNSRGVIPQLDGGKDLAQGPRVSRTAQGYPVAPRARAALGCCSPARASFGI